MYQIAKNCRTSVEMIEKHYAAHIKNTLDVAAINVMRPKAAKAVERAAKFASSGERKAKAGGKPSQVERTARKQAAREAGLRVTDINMTPGSLTAEANG